MKITVLGSSGQIGAYLTEYLRDKGHEVIDLTKTSSSWRQLDADSERVIWRRAIKNADFVFVLAFDVGGSRYLKKYQHTFDFVNNNTRIMANVFDLLEEVS